MHWFYLSIQICGITTHSSQHKSGNWCECVWVPTASWINMVCRSIDTSERDAGACIIYGRYLYFYRYILHMHALHIYSLHRVHPNTAHNTLLYTVSMRRIEPTTGRVVYIYICKLVNTRIWQLICCRSNRKSDIPPKRIAIAEFIQA